MLDVLGLGSAEESAYRHLIGQPSASLSQLAGALELSPAEVGLALATLEAKGLIATSTAGPEHYVASPPAVALGALLLERQQELKHAELELHALADRYRNASDRTVTDVVDVVTGQAAVAQRFAQIQRSARSEVLAFVRAESQVVSAEENVEEDEALRRGVRYCVVVEQGLLERPGFYAAAQEAAQYGETIRATGRLPLRLIVVDRELALIPLASEGRPSVTGALLVHPSGLLDALVALFEHVWQGASSLSAQAGTTADQVDLLDRQVLDLLLAGLTDQAVGKQLGISLRTVQRRVHALMDRASVTTRIQLGREVERRGWLGRD